MVPCLHGLVIGAGLYSVSDVAAAHAATEADQLLM